MVYTPDVPQSTDDPSASQPLLLGNFQSLNTFLSVNHVALNASGEGKHTFIEMVEQSSDPTTAANEGTIYAKEYTTTFSGTPTAESMLFFRNEGDGAVTVFGGPSRLNASGYTYLPGGILMQWNRVTATSGSPVTFPVAFGAAPYYVNFTLAGASAAPYNVQGTPTSTAFTPNLSGGPREINYIAIGPAA